MEHILSICKNPTAWPSAPNTAGAHPLGVYWTNTDYNHPAQDQSGKTNYPRQADARVGWGAGEVSGVQEGIRARSGGLWRPGWGTCVLGLDRDGQMCWLAPPQQRCPCCSAQEDLGDQRRRHEESCLSLCGSPWSQHPSFAGRNPGLLSFILISLR
jgi:hypothetical protein